MLVVAGGFLAETHVKLMLGSAHDVEPFLDALEAMRASVPPTVLAAIEKEAAAAGRAAAEAAAQAKIETREEQGDRVSE